jgi:glycosyltransferase involved in cell wall biosynthesis
MRIMFLGDRLWGTSAYAKVQYNLAKRLVEKGHQVAHTPMGRALRGGEMSYGGILLQRSSPGDIFGEDIAVHNYTKFRADILITVKEPWVFQSLHQQAINFCPMAVIDHSPVSMFITSKIKTAFRVIAISTFGQRELKMNGIESNYIPHGVDTKIYRPLSEEQRKECRKMFLLPEDAFVVLIIALNRSRKMIPRMLRGYKRFVESNPDVKTRLMLWTDIYPAEPSEEDYTPGVADVGVNLLPEILSLGLNDIVMWPEAKLIREGIPEWSEGGWDMVKLINSADCLLLCSGGEGAGLPYLEANSCGVVPIGTDYAGAPEYVGPGITVPWSDYVILNTAGTRYALADIDSMASAIERVLNTDRERASRKCRRFAERFDWEIIVEKYFTPFLEDCEADLRPLITAEGVKKW